MAQPAPLPPRAAIDIGTNTVRLLVAEGEHAGAFRVLHEEQIITRLGQGLAERRSLHPEAVNRTLTAVRRFADTARARGAREIRVVGTSALRQAPDRARFAEALRAATGLDLLVVSGEEEARLSLLGARSGAGVPPRFLLVDIGGGSTELTLAEGEAVRAALSLPLGVVHLTEGFLRHDPIAWDEYDAMREEIRDCLQMTFPRLTPLLPVPVVGTAGTVTTLAALDLGLRAYDRARVQAHRLRRGTIERLLRELGALSIARRAELPCLEPGRADVVIAGIAICLEVMAMTATEELIVSDYGLREGILLDRGSRAPQL